MSPRGAFSRSFWISVIPMFFLARFGETYWAFDNVGAWYTVICAIAFALLLGAIAAVGITFAGFLRKWHSQKG